MPRRKFLAGAAAFLAAPAIVRAASLMPIKAKKDFIVLPYRGIELEGVSFFYPSYPPHTTIFFKPQPAIERVPLDRLPKIGSYFVGGGHD